MLCDIFMSINVSQDSLFEHRATQLINKARQYAVCGGGNLDDPFALCVYFEAERTESFDKLCEALGGVSSDTVREDQRE